MFRARRDYTEICEREERFTCDRSFLFWRYFVGLFEKRENKHSFSGYRIARERWSYGRQIENIFLIYISSKENYALQLFQNRPFDFLVKPIEPAKIYHVLDNIYRISEKNSVGFEFQTQNSTYRISYKDILYFQSTGRKINIVMKKEIRTFYGKLNEIEKRIPENVFLRIHKSYLVNKNYVKEFTYEWVKMLNGDVLNISKINRADVRRKILESAADEFKNI